MISKEKPKVQYPYFSDRLLVEQLRKSLWKVRNPSHKATGEALRFYVSETESYGLCEKFVFDGFSIPWWVRWLVPKDQPGLICSAFHDSWCEKQYIPSQKAHNLFVLSLSAYTRVLNEQTGEYEYLQQFDFLGRDRWMIGRGVLLGGPRWKRVKERPSWA